MSHHTATVQDTDRGRQGMRKGIAAAAAVLLFPGVLRAGALVDEITARAQQNFPEFLELLALPNVADQPADIQRNAAFLERAFQNADSRPRCSRILPVGPRC